MAENRHLKNQYGGIFFCPGRSDLHEFRRLVQNDKQADCCNMFEIRTKNKIPIQQTFRLIQVYFEQKKSNACNAKFVELWANGNGNSKSLLSEVPYFESLTLNCIFTMQLLWRYADD